jgi:dihydrofolate reductase|tara:strand:+ start:1343 stop:1531 length:189 start_codon:yes stop_codon:yes gene_type:complete
VTTEEQFSAFCGDLEALLSRYQEEFDLNDAMLIGGMQMYSTLFAIQQMGWCCEEEEEEEEEF